MAWLWALLLAAFPGGVQADAPGAAAQTLREAVVVRAGQADETVQLPDRVERGGGAHALRHYRWTFSLPPGVRSQALYWSGLIAHARIEVNGQVVLDRLAAGDRPLPRSVDRSVLLSVPDVLWRAGTNTVDLVASGPEWLSVSPLEVGPLDLLSRHHQLRTLGTAYAPGAVAFVLGALGLCMLLLWGRRRDAVYGYFGLSSVCWALHSLWTVLPWPLLPGRHRDVWWNSLYAFFVAMLVIFCLRLAESPRRGLERMLWIFAASGPVVLYAALAFGVIDGASDVWRLLLIALVAVAVEAVFRRARRHPGGGSRAIAAVALISLVFAVHDWWVDWADADNNPVFWVPFTGLPFMLLVARALIDRFVDALRQTEQLNADLEQRVAAQGDRLREAIEQMREARDAAMSASRAKTSFLAAASHDLRQPAHAMGFYLAALRAEPLAGTQIELVERMDRSLAALDAMFDGLLDITRIDAGSVVPQPRTFALEPMLRRLAEEFAPLAEARGLRFALRLPLREALVHSDPVLLERVVRNLLANAVKYTASGGVLLACRLRSAAAGGAAAGRWRIEVWDTGCGIAPQEQEHVFEEFYQVRDAGAGTADDSRGRGLGLGLSIVQRLAQLLQVPLQLRSRPGQGSVFLLDVAALAPGPGVRASLLPAAPVPEAPDRLPAGVLAGLRVVLLEDEVQVLDAVTREMRRWGCEVLASDRAAGVLAQLPEGARLDAIVADYELGAGRVGPDEAAQLMRHLGRSVPLLVVTGRVALDGGPQAQSAAPAMLSKPVSPGRLHAWLAQAAAARVEQEGFS